MKDESLLAKLKTLKGGFVDILMVAIALGLSVGFFVAVSIEIYSLKSISIVIISFTCIIVLVLYLAHRILSSLERIIRIEGTLTFVEKDDILKPIEVEGYKVSNDIAGILKAAFTENPALENIWKNSPIICDPASSSSKLSSNQLIQQAFEYFLLENLSMHIQSYFAKHNIDTSDLKEYSREDLPDFLLKNKFFDLFTKPMKERPSFMEHSSEKEDDDIKIVWASGKDGAIFRHFELVLPIGSTLKRLNNGSIQINTKIFELNLNPRFDGYSSVWPIYFEELYIGLNDFRQIRNHQLNLDITVKFNQFSLLMGKGWKYYSWLDSVISSFENNIDDEKFLKNIGWNTVYTSYLISKNQPLMPNKKVKRDK